MLGKRQQAGGGLGRQDRSCGALEEFDREVAFETGDLVADRRLRDETPLGRAAEAEFLAHGDEVGDLTKFHVVSLFMTDRDKSDLKDAFM